MITNAKGKVLGKDLETAIGVMQRKPRGLARNWDGVILQDGEPVRYVYFNTKVSGLERIGQAEYEMMEPADTVCVRLDGQQNFFKIVPIVKDSKYFLAKYGLEFQKKLPFYRTAKLNGEHVALCEVDPKAMLALVRNTAGRHINCSVYELDDFVL